MDQSEMFEVWYTLPAIAVLGLVAGTLGGMLGVGGSVIMIPGLVTLLTPAEGPPRQHLYQAAAMIVNVVVAVPAARRHWQAGAAVPSVLKWMVPSAVLCVVLGVWLSNQPIFHGDAGQIWLSRWFATFLLYVIYLNVQRLRSPRMQPIEPLTFRVKPPNGLAVGSAMGIIAGLLGVGGGAIAVPMQQVLLRLPLRNAIANSATLICVVASIGAVYKNATLFEHGYGLADSLPIALALAPTAWIGGRAGAALTHRLPVRQIRIGFILMMILAAWKMARIPGSPI